MKATSCLDKKADSSPKRKAAVTPKARKAISPVKKSDASTLSKTHKTLTPLKPKNPNPSKMRSLSMGDINTEDLMDFDQWNDSEKLKRLELKKYKFLEQQLEVMKRKEKEMELMKSSMLKRASEINDAKSKKNKFKDEVKANKAYKQQKLNEQKEKTKNVRDYEYNRQLTFQNMLNKKHKIMAEISRADQNLMRTMLNQTMSKIDSIHKSMYLREREHKEKMKKDLKEKNDFKETQRMKQNKKNYNQNCITTESLRDKCKELEKLHSDYKSKLKEERIKVSTIDHPINYMNHTFYKNYQNDDSKSCSNFTGAYIHYSPIKKRKSGISSALTPERSSECASKRKRGCKTPVPSKKKKI